MYTQTVEFSWFVFSMIAPALVVFPCILVGHARGIAAALIGRRSEHHESYVELVEERLVLISESQVRAVGRMFAAEGVIAAVSVVALFLEGLGAIFVLVFFGPWLLLAGFTSVSAFLINDSSLFPFHYLANFKLPSWLFLTFIVWLLAFVGTIKYLLITLGGG